MVWQMEQKNVLRDKTNVLLVGGRKLLREGLTLLLRQHEHLSVVGEADAAESAAKLLRPLDVHIVVLNLSMSGQVGADLVKLLSSGRHAAKVIVLTLNPSPQALRLLLDAGAAACLTKECTSSELVEAIRKSIAGERYLSPSLMTTIVRQYAHTKQQQPVVQPLAPREREVLQRIAVGRTTKEIAREFGVSAKTVETHRRRIMDKLGRYSVAELTQYAVVEELVALENPA
jgi:two-component system, NarL family, response regulator NreC